jgi:tetratricopeptide (TPR) repeat protein/transglutaminase-like putative cysteine protease
MIVRWCVLSFAAVLAALSTCRAQTSPAHAPVKDDYSQEAAIIEGLSTKIAFDQNGNLNREQTSRIRVQTDAGVKQWGLLNFPYESATQTVEIDYVRVRKSDGSILSTPPDNAQDLDSEITRSAPFYSDLREKHVAVKGLGKGDILEYGAHWHATKPLIPGQFWFRYNFHHDGIVLGERLEISMPADRAVKVKGPQETQTIATEAASRVYAWTYTKLQNTKEAGSDEKKQTDAALGRLPQPDVQISSFQSWEEVGRWYWNLQKDRVEPTAAIRAKAAELTKGMSDDAAKLRTLYDFVSLQYRYIGIAFGIGRYQPHAADDVLSNSYGDCKDKHTLLASLLQASGVTLYPALISSTSKLDPDVPSPAQFDHIIGYLPQSKDKEAVWLDSTIEVAPAGYLVTSLRNKQALVMLGEKSIQLVTTPADPPSPSAQAFRIDGKLGDDGTFEAKVEDTTRGESGVSMRAAFRQVPQPQWKDLVQQISYQLGYSGTVSDVSASTPEAIGEAFHFSYSYNRKEYPDWKGEHHFTVPGLPFFMPAVRDDAKYPIWLGPPLEMESDSTVELPEGYKAQLPSNVDLKYAFAEYHAYYSSSKDQNILIAKRRLLVRLHEVPVAEFDDYRSFLKDLQNDVNQYVQTSSVAVTIIPNTSSLLKTSPVAALPPTLRAIEELPDSQSADANRLEAQARDEIAKRNPQGAVSSLYRAVSADPKFTRAWVMLGRLLLLQRQTDAGIDAFHKAMAADPEQRALPKVLGMCLMAIAKYEEAVAVWQNYMKTHPDDVDGPTNLGNCLVELRRYSEAATAYEAGIKIGGARGDQKFRLGSAYLRSGQTEKGAAILQEYVEGDSQPLTLNDVAYELAETNANLPKALEYAQKAVNEQEKESYDVELSDLFPEDLQCTQSIGPFWDTLGWVYFRLGSLDQAESYLNAAWLLSQAPLIGDHLGQVYEREKKTEKAIHTYRLALASMGARAFGDAGDATRRRLEHLTGRKEPAGPDLVHGASGGDELSQLRTVKLKRLVPGAATAEFFLLFSPGPKIEDVQFISGSEELKSAESGLSGAKFQVTFPEGSSARLVRRAILSCSNVTGCEVVLLPPDTVNSVE